MSEKNTAIALFETHNQAEDAIRELQEHGFDMKKLSIVGKDYHTDEHVVGYYNTGDRMMYWGKTRRVLGWPVGNAPLVRRSSSCRASCSAAGGWTARNVDRWCVGNRRCDGRAQRPRAGDCTASGFPKTAS